ncbi:MAG: DUF3429 domain-containing protein [Gammaproteobacteria bacterium]
MQKQHATPRQLGYLGLLPFMVSGLLAWIPEYHHFAIKSITIYAAVIVTFIGGVHWGLAMQASKTSNDRDDPSIRNQFIFSVIPSLVAWLAVIMAQPYTLIILAICFVSFWYWEKTTYNKALENWYITLRNQLTLVATLFIVIAWISI